MKYTLKHSFEFEGDTINEINLRRPKGKDLKKLARLNDDTEKGLLMLELLANMPEQAIGEIDAEDFVAIGEVIAQMMGVEAGNDTQRGS